MKILKICLILLFQRVCRKFLKAPKGYNALAKFFHCPPWSSSKYSTSVVENCSLKLGKLSFCLHCKYINIPFSFSFYEVPFPCCALILNHSFVLVKFKCNKLKRLYFHYNFYHLHSWWQKCLVFSPCRLKMSWVSKVFSVIYLRILPRRRVSKLRTGKYCSRKEHRISTTNFPAWKVLWIFERVEGRLAKSWICMKFILILSKFYFFVIHDFILLHFKEFKFVQLNWTQKDIYILILSFLSNN